MGHWQHFAHGADIGVRGHGATQAEAFAEAALGLTAVVTDPAGVRPLRTESLRCEAPDPELLLYEWLNALVFEMSTQRSLYSRFDLHIRDGRLEAALAGEPVDVARHEPAVEVKGATMTELAVRKDEAGGWTAQCVLDV
ncbi:MAG TPA: archease [Steroidobacteraceae bacterium]|nr:archease [Steroidobacteraceae bacterium]